MLRLENIIKNYKTGNTEFPALKGISLAFRKNEFVSILGPSGCGKTTLLNIIGGLDHYTSGDLVIEGKSTKEYKSHDWDVYRNHRIGFIFQSYNLIPHQNILENVELALTIAGYSKEEKRKKAMDALDMVGLKGSYKKMPNQLSGGQCQRVAIARALVNEPDILLGDEPTGALDSKTSVQVMELIKKISKTKLVIMVTHNPPLAEKYSTRIISLLDGNVVGDTNPYKLEAEKKEIHKKFEGVKTSNEGQVVKPSKAKMSFWSAFKLSAKNLISKKKRTIMVIAASSIGIVGVSAVLAVSTGVRGYIGNMQNDMLSGNPLRISETSLDIASILTRLSDTIKAQTVQESFKDGKIDVEYLTKELIKQAQSGSFISNDINDDYVKYLEDMPAEYKTEISKDYQISFANNIYTDAKIEVTEKDKTNYGYNTENAVYSLLGLKNIYTAVLNSMQDVAPKDMDFAPLINLAANFPSVFYQGLDNNEYIRSQYDVVKGNLPGEDGGNRLNECVVVLNRRNKLNDLVITLSGLLSQKDFVKAIGAFIENQGDVADYIKKIDMSSILGKKFYYVPNGYTQNEKVYEGVYSKSETSNLDRPFDYNYRFKLTENDGKKGLPLITHSRDGKYTPKNIEMPEGHGVQEIKIVGIITPKEGKNYGSLYSGIYFTSDLANKVISDSAATDVHTPTEINNSDIFNYLTDEEKWDEKKALNQGKISNSVFVPDNNPSLGDLLGKGIYYKFGIQKYTYSGGEIHQGPDIDNNFGVVGDRAIVTKQNVKVEDPITKETTTVPGTYIASSVDVRDITGRKMLYNTKTSKYSYEKIPYSIYVYSNSFENRDKVSSYLNYWNDYEGSIKIKDPVTHEVIKELPKNQRPTIKAPDNLKVLIAMINNLINITTVSLTVFAGLSLVVSTVMIGIITYISVMERIKEIGVIRSLGGRKKDVSHLFNAETFILGGLSGLFGILITYVFELILDVSIYAVYKIPMIANLKWYTAIIMVVLSIVLTAISGLIPAKSAANKDPVNALRSE